MAKKKASSPAIRETEANRLLNDLIQEFEESAVRTSVNCLRPLIEFPTGRQIYALSLESQVRVAATVAVILASGDRVTESTPGMVLDAGTERMEKWKRSFRKSFLTGVLEELLYRKLPFDEEHLLQLLSWPLKENEAGYYLFSRCIGGLTSSVVAYAKSNSLSEPLARAVMQLIAIVPSSFANDLRKQLDRLHSAIHGGARVKLDPGEAWSDSALADRIGWKGAEKQVWDALLSHAQSGGAGKFTAKWRKAVEPLLDAVGFVAFKEHLLRWFPLVDKPRTPTDPSDRDQTSADWLAYIEQPHVELLRGLVWCCGFREDTELARAVARLALSSYRKVPGKGPRLVSLGNACVTSLGMMPGLSPIGQLAVLKVKVKFGSAQKEIEKAFNAAATREKLPREEIEEIGVPSYGLEAVGSLRESFGDYRAELIVDGSSASLHWTKDGKPLKSVPAAVKQEHAEAVKELQASLKDINTMLPAQRERIDSLFLGQKSWPLVTWKQRYLDHPLVGTITRRLIWTFTTGARTLHGVWHDGNLLDLNDRPLSLADGVAVSLWHPIGHPVDEVLAWREWFERHSVMQPFKQAHREVYLLTDAERQTRTYSNRFAAHVLKQHQFNALCHARDWKSSLHLAYDSSYPPASRSLPRWNLRAEYWIDGAGEVNESGTFLYLTTDQVRFYRLDEAERNRSGGYGYVDRSTEEQLPLDTIPPLVFSEIMRDVDLFVGVASVGNDPNWNDGEHGGYWRSFSFGELSTTAQTRKTLLQRLVPRLKIASRCSFEDRFLIVKGDIRGYKIHLGSGNIVMQPNDQYLCIVPKQTIAGAERVFLPFEGDHTLSVILSKAFLLAEDTKIIDPTIVSQLKR